MLQLHSDNGHTIIDDFVAIFPHDTPKQAPVITLADAHADIVADAFSDNAPAATSSVL